ncbi:hypothetical protein HYR99_06690 [Candidatus Poribacteria bacterium]|nr:hypothetical protein [Candidatus Poribacteria bacterium]
MSPTQSLEELIKTLEQHPEWRERLLQVLLTEEFLRLPARMDRLEAVVAQLAEQVRALAESHQQLQLQVQALTQQVREIAAIQKGMQEEIKGIKDEIKEMKGEIAEVKRDMKGMKDDLGYLKGRDRERFYGDIRVMDKGKLLEQMDTAKALTDEEWQAIVDLDLAIEAVTRQTARPVILAMEVSWVIDSGDVERAVHRATLMQERGLPAIPVVGGKELLPDAKENAHHHEVLVMLDGRIFDKELLG